MSNKWDQLIGHAALPSSVNTVVKAVKSVAGAVSKVAKSTNQASVSVEVQTPAAPVSATTTSSGTTQEQAAALAKANKLAKIKADQAALDAEVKALLGE